MTTTRIFAAALSLLLMLAACDTVPVTSRTASDEVSRLTSLGYSVTGRSPNGDTTVLRYKGPVNASVQCAQTGVQFGTPRPRVVSSNGTVQDYQLNSYLIVGPGAKRDGLYVVTRKTRQSSRGPARQIETIAFEPSGRGTFASGLSCRAS